MSEHTPGRVSVDYTSWESIGNGQIYAGHDIDKGADEPLAEYIRIARMVPSSEMSQEEADANARRIVALWNSAHDAKLSTESVEAGTLSAMIALLKECDDYLSSNSNKQNYIGCESILHQKMRDILQRLDGASRAVALARAAIQKAQPAQDVRERRFFGEEENG